MRDKRKEILGAAGKICRIRIWKQKKYYGALRGISEVAYVFKV